MVISPDQLQYDTLPNGKVLLKRIPGQLEKVDIDDEETFLRQNFTKVTTETTEMVTWALPETTV